MAIQDFMSGLWCVPPVEMKVSELTLQRCRGLVVQRPVDAHKGTMGHALLVAGSHGMAGAAVLATRACLRSGVGKCTVCTAARNNDILQISVPEAIVTHYDGGADVSLGGYDALGIGPGLGQKPEAVGMVMETLRQTEIPTVVDADAINILAKAFELEKLPQGLIFTPHKKEFERLEEGKGTLTGTGTRTGTGTGKETIAFPADDVTRAMAFAMDVKGYVLLKGHRSALCCHDGELIYNSTGNAGMATAGSGDVLTGIITGLLARGYDRKTAAALGMYVHGLAGDLAAEELGMESLIATDIIRFLPQALKKIYS